MQPAAIKLKEKLSNCKFKDAAFEIVSNAENKRLIQAGDFLESLTKQVTAPVRWDSGVEVMIQNGVQGFIEFGEGKILAGMQKRIDKTKSVFQVACPEDLDQIGSWLEQLDKEQI